MSDGRDDRTEPGRDRADDPGETTGSRGSSTEESTSSDRTDSDGSAPGDETDSVPDADGTHVAPDRDAVNAGAGERDGSPARSTAPGTAPDSPATRSATAAAGGERRGIDPTEYTTDRRSLSPRVQLQWGVRTAITAVVVGLIVTFILGGLDQDPRLGGVLTAAIVVLGFVWVILQYRVWVYQIQDDAIYLERGVLTHVRTLVPYVRIQHVDTSRGPFERTLGLSTLVVYTAGSRGADVSIPGLTPEEARDLQQRVKDLAIEAEGDDAL